MRPLLLLAGLLLVAAASIHSAEIKKGPLAEGKNVPGAFHPYNVTEREIHPDELDETEKEDKGKDKDKEKKRYSSKGKFHCLVTEYDLDPVILLVARGINDSEGFTDLLKKLDAALEWRQRKEVKGEKKDEIPAWLDELRKKKKIDGGALKNRLRRVRAFVVILDESLRKKGDVLKEDDKRDKLEKEIQKIADDLSLKHVVLTLAASGDLEKYDIDKDDKVALTAVLYRTLTIRSSHTFTSGELEKKDAPALNPLLEAVIDKLLPK